PRFLAIEKAHGLAWSLGFYLYEQQFQGLQKFNEELNRLPRDLELSSEAKLETFARAFGLTNAEGKPDDGQLNNFAQTWLKYVQEKRWRGIEVNLAPPLADGGDEGADGGRYPEVSEGRRRGRPSPPPPPRDQGGDRLL